MGGGKERELMALDAVVSLARSREEPMKEDLDTGEMGGQEQGLWLEILDCMHSFTQVDTLSE